MKTALKYLLLFFASTSIYSQDVKLIPAVNNAQYFEGEFTINAGTKIITNAIDSLENEAQYLQNLISESSTFEISVKASQESMANFILLNLNQDYLSKGKEAYSIDVDSEGIEIQGASKAGVMRGIQTLRQLFLPQFHGEMMASAWKIKKLKLADYPAYSHRGFMLDVCRHYFDIDVVKEYIDLLAFYRMNVLHLHLTEDQGWRFASDKYPLLNSVSSKRIEQNGEEYGGLFTKAEMKEIVVYATERHISVIPEIEMPGHSQAALAAYPHLSCVGDSIQVANDWGVFKEIYCAGNDSTFIFLEDILTEVMDIFPSKYIHIGGDEAPKMRWEQCSKCQKRIKDENLKDEHELQSYFIKRIEAFLAKHDRIIIGWDEILEGGLGENATVQSWRGYEGGIEAANQQHDVIMSPTSHCYLDYNLSSIDVRKIYSFDPVPQDPDFKNSQYIIGGECNMWTEHVPDRKTLDSQVFPRMIAFSEALWTSPSASMFDNFYERLQTHYTVLEEFGIEYGLEMIPIQLKDSIIDGKPHIAVEYGMGGFNSLYKWKNENSIEEYENFTSPISLNQSGAFIVQPIKNRQFYGPEIIQYYEFHKAVNAQVNYESKINKWYTAGGNKGLVNGKTGSLDFRDGNWQGFWGEDLNLELNLQKAESVKSVELNFYHYANAWIIQPSEVRIQTSENGKSWSNVQSTKLESATYDNQKKIVSANIELEEKKKVKFIRLVVVNSGLMPESHDAAGEPSWIFLDEIIIK